MAQSTVYKEIKDDDLYPDVDDMKLRMSLIALKDKIDEDSRQEIYDLYNDKILLAQYANIRSSGIYDKGAKDKSMRATVQYPSIAMRDFIYAVMKELFGDDWQQNKRKYHTALNHELLKPWTLIGKI